MQLLHTHVHPELSAPFGRKFYRPASRGIIINGEDILLLYTARYDDYSLPGGGVDANEHIENGLIRELEEETGARNIRILSEFGRYREMRPWHKDDYDCVDMESFCYVCQIDPQLAETRLESHEISNGMRPVWINIHQAIAHNVNTMAASPKKGLSIIRETFLLRQIVAELID
ncbi:NUDIX domain-containing protein [Shewanella sp. Scap07]|uniref:NUDIX hydrolase n=1 Tax=Shewanella sp. Scap07 TaxID=2589987 RepID=UPI0015C17793|nr:NUDIX domain-containing protein [Shewanella sp. Scap07]QLE86293.1 NUDIX domain-containing protein [Shewanella sp. Scap07]